MKYEEIICYECDEVITEPICEECFKEEVYRWIREKNISHNEKKAILGLVDLTIQNVKLLPYSDIFCVLCSKQMHNVCSYCLMKQLYETIKKQVEQEEMGIVFNYKIHEFGLQRT